MTSTMGSNRQLRALRGATTAEANTAEAIGAAVTDLVQALVERNKLIGDQVVSVTFSVTSVLASSISARTSAEVFSDRRETSSPIDGLVSVRPITSPPPSRGH